MWLFGDANRSPLFSDSRQVDNFGRILQSKDALEYLERTSRPNFEVAHRLAGGDEPEIIRLIEEAADNIELALTRAHLYKKSTKLRDAVRRLESDAKQLLTIFPAKPRSGSAHSAFSVTSVLNPSFSFDLQLSTLNFRPIPLVFTPLRTLFRNAAPATPLECALTKKGGGRGMSLRFSNFDFRVSKHRLCHPPLPLSAGNASCR